MAISRAEIAAIIARNPLPDLIRRTIPLKRSGKEWLGRCPFHAEKTPSFRVWRDHFHCFGCSAHGDVITWLMTVERLSFNAALDRLGARAEETAPPGRKERAAETARQRLDALTLAPTPAFVAWQREHYRQQLYAARGWEAEPST